jgi:glycosyltransferase involved in cell wall biosynthesis
MKYGIGISTRNRPDSLQAALAHFKEFPTDSAKYVVIDDNSDDDSAEQVVLECGIPGIIYHKSPHRIGITGNKNAALWELRDCDYVFLFDDDAWPSAPDWAEKWVRANESNEVGHSMYNIASKEARAADPYLSGIMAIEREFGHGSTKMLSFSNCLGPLLYFSRACLDSVGGYCPDAPALWGYEHAAMSQRAQWAGFTHNCKYLVPALADQLIYSVDAMRSTKAPPLAISYSTVSSTTDEEKSYGSRNSVLMQDTNVYYPLEKPTWLM